MNINVQNPFVRIGLVLFFAFTVVLLSVAPAFATTSNQALKSITANIQEAASSQMPMTLEEGVAFLSGSTGLTVVEISAGHGHTLAILSDGTLWSWGFNVVGQLGLGDANDRHVPTQVGNLSTWESVHGGSNYSLAIQSNGTLWSWGFNVVGQLGLGDTNNRHVPTQVGNLTTWESISMVGLHALAIQSNGTLWAWGYNSSGQLGLGDTNDRHVPTQVGNLTTWEGISAGDQYSLAIQSNGTLWAWGNNFSGELGLGDTNNRHVPTQVGNLTTWESISAGVFHALAIQSNGTLWAWGHNSSGELGLGDTNDRHVPTQVGNLTTWESISGGDVYSLAIQSNGTLWAWGHNWDGQLGINSTDDVLVPTQVGNLNTWDSISAGQAHSLATRTDGTLWAWGSSIVGSLGLGDTGARLVPTLVHAQATANTPVHNATNVPLTTNSITITFNRVMDEDFGNVTVSGATVDMAGATWVHGTNTSTITIPIAITAPPGTTHTVTAPGLFTTDDGFGARGATAPNAGPGAFPALDHEFSFTTEGPPLPMQDTLTKTLRLPANTTIPTLAFSFTFTPVQVTLSENPTISSVAVASVPAISTQTISFNSSSTYTESSGIRTASQDINLSNLVNALTFPHAGTFVWNIEEVQTTPVVTSPSHLDFSQARYEMRVLVDRYLDVAAIELFVRVVDTDTQTVGSKVPVALFTNTYTTTVSNPLSVQKVTTGRFANHGLDFNFTLTLTNPALGGPIGNITANVVDINAPLVSLRTVPLTVGANTFVLSHDERLVIPTLPAGTTFMVSEAAALGYTASAVVTIGGTAQGSPPAPTYQNPGPNIVLTTGTYTIASSGNNSANFTNAHSYTPPTGLTLANAPYILAVLAVVTLALLASARMRKRIEELPIA